MPLNAAAISRFTSTFRTRAALGLSPATAPVMVLVPLGMLLGPSGAGIIDAHALAYLDIVISIALATLGVLVGIAAGTQRGRVIRLIAASSTEGVLTLLVVTAAVVTLLAVWGMPLAFPPLVAAAALGVAAAASAAPFAGETDEGARQIAARVADLDDVLPIVMGGAVLSLVVSDAHGIVKDLAVTLAAGIGGGLAGWLLFERAEGAERGVFVIGALSLLGGCAAFLGTSPMVAGLAAGFVWARTPGRTDQIAASDLRKFEHPLLVLLLVIGGATVVPSLMGIWLFAPYVVFRTAGKLLGGWLASRVAPGVAPSDLGAYLIPPGALGIGFILNIHQVAPAAADPLVFAVVLGAVVSEVIAMIVMPAAPAQG